MNFFSIDCSTDLTSFYIYYKNRIFLNNLQRNQFSNDTLTDDILRFLNNNKINIKEIDEIFVNQGPGSFSGIRGSIATAKGLCLSQKKKLFGYNNFLLIAAKFYDYKDFIFSIYKSKKDYFIQKFDHKLNQKEDPKKILKNKIITKYKNKKKIIAKNNVNNCDSEILNLPNLHIVDRKHLNLAFLRTKGLLEYKSIKPLYLY